MKTSAVLLACLLSWVAVTVHAQEDAYVRELPPPERVLADIRGKDQLDTLARQVAAFNALHRIVEDMADTRRWGELTDAEQAIMRAYWDEAERLRQEAIATFDPRVTGVDSPRAKWFFASGRYERDDDFREELLERYFKAATRDRYRSTTAAADARLDQFQREEAARLAGKPLSTWNSMTPAERESASNFAVVMGVLIALCLVRELRKFGVARSKPPTIRAGFRLYRLAGHSGVVSNYRRWVESVTTTTQRLNQLGQVLSTQTYTQSYEHESFRLQGEADSRDIHIVNGRIYPAEGDTLTAVEAFRRRSKQGEYILFRNVSQNLRVTVLKTVVIGMFKVRGWIFVPVVLLAFMLGSSTDLLLPLIPRGNPALRGFMTAFISWPVYLIVAAVIARIRTRRFEKRGVPMLSEWLHGHERQSAVSVREVAA